MVFNITMFNGISVFYENESINSMDDLKELLNAKKEERGYYLPDSKIIIDDIAYFTESN